MPHYWNDILVVTDDELIPDWWNSTDHLGKEIQRYKRKDYGIKRVRKGGGGHPRLIRFDSLPQFVQDAIGDPRKTGHPLERFYKRLSEAYDFYTNADGEGFTYPDGSHLKPHTIDQLVVNASTLSACVILLNERITVRKSKNSSIRGVLRTVHYDCCSYKDVMQKAGETPHTLPQTYRHFKKAWDDYETLGLASLVKDAKGKTKANALKVDEKHADLLNNLFAGQETKPYLIDVAKQYGHFLNEKLDILNDMTGELYQANEYKQLGLTTIKQHLTKWEKEIGSFKRRNKDGKFIAETFTPYHSFKRPQFAGSIISIDDRQPPFEYEKGKRMWFYLAVDLASECITTWVYGKSKEGIMLEFYRQMVRNYHKWGWNLPWELEAEKSLNDSFKNTFLKDGAMFQDVRILPNKPWAKRAERYWRELRYGLEKSAMGWIARPFAKMEANREKTDKVKLIPYQQLAADRLRDIETFNNMPHSEHEEMSRFEYAEKFQNPDLKPTNYKAILPWLGIERQTSCHRGIVQLCNGKWILADNGKMLTGEPLINKMRLVEDKDIKVYYIDDNKGEVIKAMVFDEGRYICELVSKPEPNKSSQERTSKEWEAFQNFHRYVETINAFQAIRAKSIDKISITDYSTKRVSNSFSIGDTSLYDAHRREQTTKFPIIKTEKEPKPVPIQRNWDDQFEI